MEFRSGWDPGSALNHNVGAGRSRYAHLKRALDLYTIILDLPSIGGTDIMVSGGQNLSKPCRKFCSDLGAVGSLVFEG